jgi:hypothetical protein
VFVILKQRMDTVKVETDMSVDNEEDGLALKLMKFVYHESVNLR